MKNLLQILLIFLRSKKAEERSVQEPSHRISYATRKEESREDDRNKDCEQDVCIRGWDFLLQPSPLRLKSARDKHNHEDKSSYSKTGKKEFHAIATGPLAGWSQIPQHEKVVITSSKTLNCFAPACACVITLFFHSFVRVMKELCDLRFVFFRIVLSFEFFV